MLIEKEIKELSELYVEMTKRYREIKTDYVDEETKIEHVVLEDINNYLNELLNILPISITITCCDRLTIHLLKNEFYKNKEGQSIQKDVIVIADSNVYEKCMTLDNELSDIKFCGFENATTSLNLRTLKFMCAEWKDIKKSIYQQTIEELDNFIKRRMMQIKERKEKLHYFKNWEV